MGWEGGVTSINKSFSNFFHRGLAYKAGGGGYYTAYGMVATLEFLKGSEGSRKGRALRMFKLRG